MEHDSVRVTRRVTSIPVSRHDVDPLGKNEDGSYKYLTSFGLMHEDAIAYAGNALRGDLRGVMQKTIASANPCYQVAHRIQYEHKSLFAGSDGGRRLDDLTHPSDVC